jgi:hypothetical protein
LRILRIPYWGEREAEESPVARIDTVTTSRVEKKVLSGRQSVEEGRRKASETNEGNGYGHRSEVHGC